MRFTSLSVVAAIACGSMLFPTSSAAGQEQAGQPQPPSYAVIVPAGDDFQVWRAVGEGLAKHRQTQTILTMRLDDMDATLAALKDLAPLPRYVAFIAPPEWIEDNFVGRVFEGLTKLDDDALLDCAHGFITGATAEDAHKLIERTIAVEADRAAIPKRFVGIGHTFAANDLGPFATAQADFHKTYGYETAAIIGVDDSDAWQKAKADDIKHLNGASLIYAAGHGMGDWFCAIEGSLTRDLHLESAIIINGTCHSATTLLRHDIDPKTFGIVSTPIKADDSIALNFIHAGAIAIMGSTASSGWGNVGPAIDLFFHEGKSMGESLMVRLNAHLEDNAIEDVSVMPFVNGRASPQFVGPQVDPAGIQSISRVVLLGDPAYTPFPDLKRLAAIPAVAPLHQGPVQHPQPRPVPVADPARAAIPVAELIAELDDPNAPRFRALNDLIARGKDAVEPLIEAMKTSPNWQVPKALGAIGDARALDPLIERLAARPPSPMREVVIEALELISGKQLGSDVEAWRTWRREAEQR